MTKEIRLSDIRMNNENNKVVLENYALFFDKESLIGDDKRGFIEKIERTALENTNIKDVTLKYNHLDNLMMIARTRNESLVLTVDDVGLKARTKLLNTQSNKVHFKLNGKEI